MSKQNRLTSFCSSVTPEELDNEIFSLFSVALRMKNSCKGSTEENARLYSTTKRVLEIYRICVWSLNMSAKDIQKELEFISGDSQIPRQRTDGQNIYLDLLDAAEQKGFDVYDTWIPGRVRSISKSSALLEYADRVLNMIKTYPYDGERYYKLLFLNYFDTSHTRSTGINVRTMNIMGYSNEPSYYKHKKEAISLYSSIFWDTIDKQLVLFLSEDV